MQQQQQLYFSTGLTPINEAVINHIPINQQQQQATIIPTLTPIYPRIRSHPIQVQPVQQQYVPVQTVDQFSIAVPQPVKYECIPSIVPNALTSSSEQLSEQADESQKITNNININIASNDKNKSSGNKTNFILGIVIGVLITFILIIAAIITLLVLKQKTKVFTNNFGFLKLVKSEFKNNNCGAGLTGINCDIQCLYSNHTPPTVRINFKYTTDLETNTGENITIIETKSFYGLLLDSKSILIEKSKIFKSFHYNYLNNNYYKVYVTINKYNPTYESMYSAQLSTNDSYSKFNNEFNSNIAVINQNMKANLALIVLASETTYTSTFDIDCLFYFELNVPTHLVGIQAQDIYENINWIKLSL